MKIKVLGTFVLTLFLLSCGGSKYSLEKMPEDFVELGSGGGFTGEYTYYKIATNGQIFTSKSGDTSYAGYGKISKKIAKKAYKTLDKLQDKKISEPGNLNYFMFRAEGDSMTSWLWSDDKKPAEELATVYKTLSEAISNIKVSEK